MSKCRGCGAEIDWIRTPAGRSMPIDPEPVFVKEGDGGCHFITDEGEMISGREVPENGEGVEVAFVPHWATCPEASRFKRGRK